LTDGALILVAGVLLALGIGATLLAGRLRVPGLVLFLGLGMAIGSDGLGLIDFADTERAQTVGIIALSLILFEGGFAAGWGEIRPVLAESVSLAAIGTLVTAVVTGLAAAWLLDFSTLEGLLLGSTVAASDAAAIFSVLRGSSLKRRLARTLEAESAMNDPVAAVLVLGFIEWIRLPDYGFADMLVFFVLQLAIGGIVGLAVGRAAVAGFRRVSLASGGLYPVASIAAAAVAFGAADTLGGSGFLAVYIAGIMLGSGRIPASRTVGDFHDGLAWVSQIALFLTLGLLVSPSAFGGIAFEGLLIAGVLMFVARPLATAVSVFPAGYSAREVVLLGWAGLRGAVPIVLATFSVIEGVQDDSFYNLVFFVVLTSTLLQGATFEPLARALGVTGTEPALPRPLIEVGTIRRLGAEVIEYPVAGDDAIVGRLVSELGLPREALVSVIVREDQALLPRGSTPVKALDRLHILVREPVRREVEGLFDRWRAGPIGVEAIEAARPPGRAPIFSVRPWRASDGDAGDPRSVAGVGVIRSVRLRQGVPGALVQLEDGRLAVTGEGVAAVGAPGQLFRYCRERIRRAGDEDARAWWQEVAGLVSQRAFR